MLILLFLLIPYLLGTFLAGQTKSRQYINGILLLFSMFEIHYLWARRENMSMQEMSQNFSMIISIILILAVIFQIIFVFLRWKKNKEKKKQFKNLLNKEKVAEFAVIAGAFFFVSITFFINRPLLESRFMLPETAVTMLQTNSLSGYNPLTGELIETAGSLKESLYSLPAFYAWLSIGTQINILSLLFQIVPIWVLFISFLVFYQFAKLFFAENGKARKLFMWIYALVLLFGDEAYMNEAYQLLHYAYEGTTILACVLLPYCFFLMFSMFFGEKNGNEKKRIGSFLCVIVELIIVLVAGFMAAVWDFGAGLLIAMIGTVLLIKMTVIVLGLLGKVKEKVWQR